MPYARALLRALPGGDRRAGPLEAIAGTVPALKQAFNGCRFAPRCAMVMMMAHCAATLPELKEYVADRLVVMKAGRVEEQGACADVLARPSREYTKQLLAAVPRLVTV